MPRPRSQEVRPTALGARILLHEMRSMVQHGEELFCPVCPKVGKEDMDEY